MKRTKRIMWITLGIIGLLAIIVAIVLNHPSFGRSPRGERLERIMQSHNYRDGKFPNIDLALLENGQYNEAWRNIHTMPDLLPQAIKDLGAAKTQPVHHSKYALSRHAWNEPMDGINAVAATDSSIHLLGATIGQSIVLNSSPSQR